MKRCLVIAAVAALAGCGDKPAGEQSAKDVASELSEVRIEPGEWEATSEILDVSGPGMPPEVVAQMKGHKTVLKNCVTPEQAAKPDASFLTAQKDANCTYENFAMTGGKMTGKMTCAPKTGGKMVMAMDGTYSKDSYDLTMDMNNEMGPGQSMAMKARTTAKRLGACA